MKLADVRRLALSLPETTEEDHHGMASFRIRGRIFATVPDAEHVRVMASEEDIHAAVAESRSCEPFYWGKRLACVVVDLASCPPALVRELLWGAWERKAPKRLLDRR